MKAGSVKAIAVLRELLLVSSLTLAAFIVRVAVFPYLGTRQPFVLFYISIIVSARFCSLPASLFSVAAGGLLSNYFFMEPLYTFGLDGPADYAGTAAYLAVGGTICFLFERLKQQSRSLSRVNRQLQRSLDEMKHTNEALEQFSSVASHDLQEPLRNIVTFSELITSQAEGQFGEESRQYLAVLNKSAAKAVNLVHDLLEYSRAAKIRASIEPVYARQALDEAVRNLETFIRERNAAVTSGDMPLLSADAKLLAHVFQNLIANGIKFNRSVEPKVHVAAHFNEGGARGDEWRFEVIDNGIGVDPVYCEKIFAMFQRLHNDSEFPGTGIGLAICRKMVDSMGGRIWVEPNPGGGSRFCFTVPLESR